MPHFLTKGEICNDLGRCRSQVYVWRSDATALSNFTMDSAAVAASFSPDGQFIIMADEGGTVSVRDLAGRVVSHIGGFLSELTSFGLSGDGNRLVTVSCPNTHQGACLERAIHIWDPNGPLLESRRLVRIRDPRFHQSSPQETKAVLRYSPQGKFLFIASNDATRPVVLNTITGEMMTLASSADAVSQAWFDGGETRILTNGEKNEDGALENQRVQLWDGRGGQLKMLSEEYPEDIGYTPVGASKHGIVIGKSKGIIEFWSWQGDRKGQRTGHLKGIDFVDISSTEDARVTVDHSGLALIWDAEMNAVAKINVGSLNAHPEGQNWGDLRFDTAYKACFTTDGQHILIVGPKGMSLWNRGGQKLWDRDVDVRDFTLPQVSKDRILVVQCMERGRGGSIGSLSMCYDSMATLWDMKGNKAGALDPGTEGDKLVSSVVFNPQGNRIITVDDDHTARLWDAGGNLITELFAPVNAADFDPNGGLLATVSGDGIVRIWHIWDDLKLMISEAKRRLQQHSQMDRVNR